MPFAPRKELVTDPPAAANLAARNAPRYEAMLQNSLTLTPFDGAFLEDGNNREIELCLHPPEVAVVVLKRTAPQCPNAGSPEIGCGRSQSI